MSDCYAIAYAAEGAFTQNKNKNQMTYSTILISLYKHYTPSTGLEKLKTAFRITATYL